jgi:O-antigen ligase
MEFMMSGKMVVRLMLVMMVIALVLTRSRMGNGTFFIGLFLTSAWVMARSPQLRKSAGVLIVSLLVVDLVIIGQWVGLSNVINRLEATELTAQAASAPALDDPAAPIKTRLHREESLNERMRPARDAMAMVRDRPWTGFGGGTFYTAFTRYKVESLPLPYNHAHNDYVEIAADVGLPGLLLLAGVVILTAMRAIQLMQDRSSPHVRGVAIGVGMGLICALLHALVDLNLQINANAMTLTVLLAVVWSVPTQRPVTSHRSR